MDDMARLLDVSQEDIETWTKQFADNLSESTRPSAGYSRLYTESDTCVLALVKSHWEESPDIDHIHDLLGSGEQNSERIVEFVQLNTQLFQEPPDDLDETWDHGVLLSSIYLRPMIEVARAYKYAADILVKEALSCQEPHLLDYPVFFNYRQTLELYLKLILNDSKKAKKISHDLGALITAVETKLGGKTNESVKKWLREFNQIDPTSDLFRYGDRAPDHPDHIETWIDFCQLKTVMDRLCEAFEGHILRH